MATGGSAGHSGLHALEIREGISQQRTWEVDVLSPDEVRESGEDAKKNAKETKHQAQLDRDKTAVLAAVAKLPNQQGTKTDIKERTGRNSQAIDSAVERVA